ncbi:hypothetical protein GGR54DRAFT_587554 [Hypoxylon sp. NC1633]|nr:hypothetical protein GGR54DRAFT_587554 [Hypoxylon sp. NC1633]
MADQSELTADQMEWMRQHRDNSRIAAQIAVPTVCLFCTTLFVSARLVSRRLLRGSLRLQIDDWLILIAWGFYIGMNIVAVLSTQYGSGQHIIFAADIRMYQIVNVIAENFYAVILALLKISMALLYRRVFGSACVVWFDRLTWIVMFFSTVLCLQIMITGNLQCIPLSVLWDKGVTGTCINYAVSATVTFAVNIATELTLLSMPIPLVWRLRLPRQRKWMLVLTFSAGACTCILTSIQFGVAYTRGVTADMTWDNTVATMLGDGEVMLAFLATSIPTYRPLYVYLFHKSVEVDRNVPRYPMQRRASWSWQRNLNNKIGHNGVHTTKVSVGGESTQESSTSRSTGGIIVTDQIDLVRYSKIGNSWVRVDDDSEQAV